MNYRHAFHAGGFADVIKHIVLVRMLSYLQEKQAAFRVIDTHAGAGVYDLTGDEAQRSGEWLTGVARVMQARFSETALPLVAPYLDIVRAFNPPRELKAFARRQSEFEEEDCAILSCSVDSVYSHKAWVERDLQEVRYPMLSDVTRRIP